MTHFNVRFETLECEVSSSVAFLFLLSQFCLYLTSGFTFVRLAIKLVLIYLDLDSFKCEIHFHHEKKSGVRERSSNKRPMAAPIYLHSTNGIVGKRSISALSKRKLCPRKIEFCLWKLEFCQ